MPFYGVARGHEPGVYTHWYGRDGAEEQIHGFSRAGHQRFETWGEAKQFVDEAPGCSPPRRPLAYLSPSLEDTSTGYSPPPSCPSWDGEEVRTLHRPLARGHWDGEEVKTPRRPLARGHTKDACCVMFLLLLFIFLVVWSALKSLPPVSNKYIASS